MLNVDVFCILGLLDFERKPNSQVLTVLYNEKNYDLIS